MSEILGFDRSRGFVLHPQLQDDTLELGHFPLSYVRLMNNMLFPWVILIPKRPDLSEITELLPIERSSLMEEIALISGMMQRVYAPDKMNIAALGNVVPQLHIHVIARYATDQAWPNPVWGQGSKAYSALGLLETSTVLKREFAKIVDFVPGHSEGVE